MQVHNGITKVSGLKPEEYKKLWSELSYEIETGKVSFKSKINADGKRESVKIPEKKRVSLLERGGIYPTGLLSFVVEFIEREGIQTHIDDRRIEPEMQSHSDDFEIAQPDFAPLEWQVEAACAALDAGRGIIAAPTGTGKSFLACMILIAFGVKTVICVPSLGLKEQLTATINWLFGEGTAGPLVKRKAAYTVTVENIDAFRGTDDLSGVDLLIIDEYHHSAATTYRELSVGLWKDIYFRIGLTATPFRSRGEEELRMAAIVSKVVYRLEYHDAVAKGLIVPMEVYYVDAPKPEGRAKTYTRYDKAYKGLVVDNELATDMIAEISSKLYDSGKSSIILCRQIDHGNAIKDKLDDLGYDVPFAEGESDFKSLHIENFCKQSEPQIIGTVGVLGEGVDTKPAEWVVVAGAGKAKVQLMQNLGRGFRTFPGKEKCTIILVRYSGHRWLESHFDECVKHIKAEYNLTVKKLPDLEELLAA